MVKFNMAEYLFNERNNGYGLFEVYYIVGC